MKMEVGTPMSTTVPATVINSLLESVAAAEEVGSEVYYGIQIMGLGRRLESGDKAFKGLEVNVVKSPDSNIYKYVTAKSKDQETASARLKEVRKKFPEAFLVKVTGERVERVK